MMRNFILYLQEQVHPWTTTAGGIKTVGHCMDHPYPIIEIRNIFLLTHLREKMLMS